MKIWKVDYADSFSGQEITDREKLILKIIISSSKQQLSHREIEESSKLTRSKVDKALQSLLGKNVIEKIGRGRATKYGIRQSNEQILALAQELPKILGKILTN